MIEKDLIKEDLDKDRDLSLNIKNIKNPDQDQDQKIDIIDVIENIEIIKSINKTEDQDQIHIRKNKMLNKVQNIKVILDRDLMIEDLKINDKI